MPGQEDENPSGSQALQPRHRARQAALQILYQWEVGRTPIGEAAETYWLVVSGEPPADVRRLAVRLALGTVADLERIDALLEASTEHWRVGRMAAVDRLILRMAVYQLLAERDTPRPVIINEALELARTFSGDESVAFVNGVLDAIRRKLDDDAAGT
ncbi:MAG: transcription antitermination factor NusB [Vicinamibacterales bacterium]